MSTAREEAVQARQHSAGEGLKDALLTFCQIAENRVREGRLANEVRDAKDAKEPRRRQCLSARDPGPLS